MSRFPLVEEDQASTEVREIYRDFRQGMKFPELPTYVLTQGASPSMLAGTWGLVKHVLLEGELPRAIKELIFLAVSVDRECEYCKEAHTACCRILGVDDEVIEAVTQGLKGDIPRRIRDILRFSVKCAATPEELTEQDFDSLSRHGINGAQTLEVIATASAAVYATIIADATLLAPDEMFSEA